MNCLVTYSDFKMKKKTLFNAMALIAISSLYGASKNFSGSTGFSAANIYQDSNGKIKLTTENLSMKIMTGEDTEISFSFDAFQFESNFDQCSSRLNSYALSNDIKFNTLKFTWTFGIMGSDEINVNYQDKEYKSCNNSIEFLGISPEYRTNSFFVKPILLYAHADSSRNDSSFYWFNGWTRINNAVIAGINAGYKNFEALAAGAKIDVEINNPDSENLAKSKPIIWAGALAYNFRTRENEISFKPFVGGLFFKAEFNAMLTSQNQGYFFFPYKYYEGSGNINASILIAGTQFNFARNNFSLKSDLLFAFALSQNGLWKSNYSEKKNFIMNGESGTNSGDLGFFDKSGLIALNIDANYKFSLSRRYKKSVEFGIKKAFFIPIGKNPLKNDDDQNLYIPTQTPPPSPDTENSSDQNQTAEPTETPEQTQIPAIYDDEDSGFSIDWDLVKRYLASCLAVYVKIHF